MSVFLSKITAPIPGDSPFGADVNHDPDYERLKNEIGKLGDIDVNAVEALSLKILAGKAKDVRAMAWLAYAVLRKGEIGRLADVFCALADYCQDSFDRLFPPREAAKLAALRWLSESRFTSRCPKVEASVDDADSVARLKDALSRLRPALEKQFPSSGAPFPSLLYKRVLEWEKSIEASKSAQSSADNDDAHQPAASQPVNLPVDRPASSPAKPVSGGGAGSQQDAVSVKLTRGELQEIINCVSKIEALLRRLA